jgi:hypothetical protein
MSQQTAPLKSNCTRSLWSSSYDKGLELIQHLTPGYVSGAPPRSGHGAYAGTRGSTRVR